MKTKKLYEVTTNVSGYNPAYVIAESFYEAEAIVKESKHFINTNHYSNRDIISIKIVAENNPNSGIHNQYKILISKELPIKTT